MEHVSHIGGLKLNPYVTLSDGVVVAFGLFLANLAMSPALRHHRQAKDAGKTVQRS